MLRTSREREDLVSSSLEKHLAMVEPIGIEPMT